MGLESGTYISQLNSDNPATSDDVAEGDDHLKLIKAVLKNQFSGLSGTTAITSSEAELNILDGVTSTAAITIDSSADMTLGGGIACADEEIGRPKFKDYAETINAIGGTGGGTQDIDLTAGNVVSATVDTSANTFTFSNPSATGKACSFTLFLTNGGSQTVNWPGSVDWAGGSAPSLTSSGVDVLTFTTLDAGTIWYGFAAGTDMK